MQLGYMSHRRRVVARVLDRGAFPHELPAGYGVRLDERVVEYPWLLGKLGAESAVVLDAGSTLNFEFVLRQPQMANKRLFVSTLAPELRAYPHRGVGYVFEDFRRSCFRDEYFDVVVCASTLEHVGLDNTLLYTADAGKREHAVSDYLTAVAEFRRMLRPGGRLLITVPYGVHEVHGWYQVFDAAMVQSIVDAFGAAVDEREFFRYGADGWRRSDAVACADADTFDVHRGMSYTEDYLASARAVCCLSLVKA